MNHRPEASGRANHNIDREAGPALNARGRAGRTMKKTTIDKWGRAAALQAFGQGPKGGRIAQSSMAFAPLAPGSGVGGAPGSAPACARAPRLLRAARQHDALPDRRVVTTRRECDETVPN